MSMLPWLNELEVVHSCFGVLMHLGLLIGDADPGPVPDLLDYTMPDKFAWQQSPSGFITWVGKSMNDIEMFHAPGGLDYRS